MSGTRATETRKDHTIGRKVLLTDPTGKQLADRVSNTSEETAEYAWQYAQADFNRRAHEQLPALAGPAQGAAPGS